MTDKELLELAARAAGMEMQICMESGRPAVADMHGGGRFWNPLTDDGDALRLAVKLGLHMQCDTNDECLRDADAAIEITAFGRDVAHSIEQQAGSDPYAATRRAIVRAAAEIGKTL